jgi:predicted O-methyltransferase YrrM
MLDSVKKRLYNQLNANRLRQERDDLIIQNSIQKKQIKEVSKIYDYFTFVEPGHFYSPIPAIEASDNIKQKSRYSSLKKYDAIDYNDSCQEKLIKNFGKFYKDNPIVAKTNERYIPKNDQFGVCDATFLYGFMRYYKPKSIVEIGSGHSSALMMDINERFFDNSIKLTFIEPYPTRLKSVMGQEDAKRYKIIEKRLETVGLEVFEQLGDGDILFIDSSHISKLNSDVNYYLFNIMPILKPGVIIHVHDIFYPFEYPKAWIKQKRYWNEAYMLKAFMQWNSGFKILLLNSYVQSKFPELVAKNLPLCSRVGGAQLWIQKR